MTATTAQDSAAETTTNGLPSPLVTDTPLPLPTLCARIYERIEAFLHADGLPTRLKAVQQQTRISLDVIAKALEDYR